jgi:hypothetical protein
VEKPKLSRKVKRNLKRYVLYSSILLALMLVLYLTRINPVSILVMGSLIIVAAMSKVYKRVTSMSIGFELVTPAVMIFAFKVDILFAIVSAVFLVIASDFISGRIIPNAIIFEIIAYIIISAVAGIFMTAGNLAWLSVALIIFRNVWLFFAGVFIAGTDPFRMFMGTFPNIFINGFIMANAGAFISGLI